MKIGRGGKMNVLTKRMTFGALLFCCVMARKCGVVWCGVVFLFAVLCYHVETAVCRGGAEEEGMR